jgi:hypothetical protein
MYKIIILQDVLFMCETPSLTLRGEKRLVPFEYRVLRRIFNLIRRKVIGT